MALPKAVQQQVEEADRLVAGFNGDKTGEAPETDPAENPAEPENVVTETPEQSVSQETNKPADPVPDSKWEAKYHTLKGMYDAEVPRLHAQVRELNTQVQTLIAEVERAKVQTPAEPQKVTSLITEQDKEAFGPDLIDLINRAAESQVASLRTREVELVDEIKQLKSQLGNVSERQVVSDKDRFLSGLSQRVSDWEALNTDQGFLTWLQEVDPVYGLPRQVALTNAYEILDVGRVATIFETYKSLITPKQANQSKAQQELQRQVAPTRSRSATPPADAQNNKIYTQTEIAMFYDEWRRGLIDNDDAVRIEKDIHAASTEGRIR